jgi:hypothetical protein
MYQQEIVAHNGINKKTTNRKNPQTGKYFKV